MHSTYLATVSLLVAVGLWWVTPSFGSAADFRGADTVTITEAETLRDSLYAAGSVVTIDGTVDGDVFAAAQSVIVRGRITGSLFAAAQRIDVAGTVDGNVRAASQEILVSRRVAGDLMAVGQTVGLGVEGSVGRDALLLGQSVDLAGNVERSIKGAGQDVRLNGAVGGGVDLYQVETVVLGPRASIAGDLSYESAREVARESGSEVRGRITRRDPPPERHPEPIDRLGGIIFGILAVTVLGAAALALAPRMTSAAATAAIHQALVSLGWGFGLLVGIPIVAVGLFFTFVGIPLALILLVVYGVLLYSSQVVVALGLGRLLLGQLRPVDRPGWSILAVLVGALIIGALRSLPVVDAIATLVIMVLGLGGIWIAYLEARGTAMRPLAPGAQSQ